MLIGASDQVQVQGITANRQLQAHTACTASCGIMCLQGLQSPLISWKITSKVFPLLLNQSKILLQNLSLLSKLSGKQKVQSLLVGI